MINGHSTELCFVRAGIASNASHQADVHHFLNKAAASLKRENRAISWGNISLLFFRKKYNNRENQ